MVLNMNNFFITHQSTLLHDAENQITQSNYLLEEFAKEWSKVSISPLVDIETIRTFQLILQYRLDTQSTLRQLSSMQNYLRQLLGIETLHSIDLNIERMEYALGNEDLHHILAMLNKLVDALLSIVAQNIPHHIIEKKKSLESSKKHKLFELIARVIEKQKAFVSTIDELRHSLEDQGEAPYPRIVYDHIAALEGPISRFYQALQHGLILSASLYQQMDFESHLEYQLANTLVRTDQLLQNFNPLNEQGIFKPVLENTKSIRLEERASIKRLGNFFNH